jgi:hypothetical protein
MGSSAVGRQRHDGDRVNSGRKRDLRKGIGNGYGSTPVEGIHHPKSRAQLLADAPRPTHKCDFIWKPRHKTLSITLSEGNLRLAKWALLNGPKQARNEETRAHEHQVSEVAPQAGKGTWVSKQNQPLLGLVDQLENHTRPSPSLVDQNGVVSSSKVDCTSSTRQMDLSDDDSAMVDGFSGSEEDGLTTTEAVRDLVVHTSVSDVLGVECVTSGDTMVYEEVGTEVSPPLVLDGVRGSSSPSLPLAWSTRPNSERTQSPLVYEPLAKIAPMGFSEFTDQYSEDVLALEEAMSLWVEQKYRDFGELVGMPIARFEAECIALLRRIDAERKKGRHTPGPHKPTR